ncbi:MAG TPA: hypothetical protein VH853_02680 [Polyangia bacterium]|nr:hypothetical protein [Polyangia bacterium]
MRPGSLVLVAIVLVAVVVTTALASPALAFEEFTPTEALGMGGASRAWALADEGPLLNPSGMSLTKAYTIDGTYGYASPLSQQFLHASIVDSTSPFNLAGGLYYTYHATGSSGGPSGHGHEGGLALSFPFGPYVAIGGTLKYFKLEGGDAFEDRGGGLTFDIGATIRPIDVVSLAVVGTNLRNLGTSEATQAVGYGVALIPSPTLLLALDGLTRLTADNQTGRKGTSVMGGGSYTLFGKLVVRAGGGYDASTGTGYATFGLSGISEIGAFEGGLRQDLTSSTLVAGGGETRETVVGVSLRLFIPASQTQDPSLDMQDPRAPVNNP